MQKRATDWFKYLIKLSETNGGMFHDYLEQFYYHCRVKNLTEKTISGYGESLSHFYHFLETKELKFEEVKSKLIQDYVMSQKGKLSDYTVNTRLRVLRLFFNFLRRESLWANGDPGVKLIRTEKKLKPILTLDQLEKLLSIPDKKTFQGYRNFSLLYTFWDTLIRLSELINLKVSDVNIQSGIMKVYGKGRKERIVPIGMKLAKHLHYYWFKYRNLIPGEFFFCRKDGTPLPIRRVEKILEDIGKKCGIKVTPHLLRHSGATFWIKSGAQPLYLQNLMGHTSMSVTQKYINLASVDDLKAHHNKYSPGDHVRV